jgi:hypothetical protein
LLIARIESGHAGNRKEKQLASYTGLQPNPKENAEPPESAKAHQRQQRPKAETQQPRR